MTEVTRRDEWLSAAKGPTRARDRFAALTFQSAAAQRAACGEIASGNFRAWEAAKEVLTGFRGAW